MRPDAVRRATLAAVGLSLLLVLGAALSGPGGGTDPALAAPPPKPTTTVTTTVTQTVTQTVTVTATVTATATVTTTVTAPPTTTTTPPPPACVGTVVAPGDSIQAKVDATASGGTLCFATGTYTMTGNVSTGTKTLTLDFRAGSDPDAIIDGNDGGFIGFNGPQDATGVTYLGGVFQHFGNAGSPTYVSPIIVKPNDVVDGGEFLDNFNRGFAVQGSNARITNVYTHDNGRYGFTVNADCQGCPGPVGVIIEDSEIAFNNTRQLSTSDDAGGTKFPAEPTA